MTSSREPLLTIHIQICWQEPLRKLDQPPANGIITTIIMGIDCLSAPGENSEINQNYIKSPEVVLSPSLK